MSIPDSKTNTGQSARQSAAKIFRNARMLISGKAAAAVLSLAYLAIASRTLGPEGLGYLVLAHAYVQTVAYITRFQSWQAIVRFGAPLISNDQSTIFKTLLRFTIKLDLLSGVLAIAVALGLASLVGGLMNWPDEAMSLVYLYCLATPFLIAATPTGVLQLYDSFKSLGWQLTILPGVRFVGAILILAYGGGLTEFLTVWIVSAVLSGASLWILGWRELKKRSLLPSFKRQVGEKADRAWLPFMIRTNLSSTLELTQTNLPVLIVGAMLGSAASGFLQIATNLSNLIAHPANMLNHATYPELSKVLVRDGRDEMRGIAWRSVLTGSAIAAPFVIIYLLFGKQLAVAVGGSEFAPAGILVGLMAMAQLWRIASVVFESAALATGRAGYVLGSQIASSIILILIMVVSLPSFGPIGAPLALIAGSMILIARYLYVLYRQLSD